MPNYAKVRIPQGPRGGATMPQGEGSWPSESAEPLVSEDTPLLSNSPEVLSSVGKTLGNILIATVGASVLGLPYTFLRTGWLAGLLILSIVGAVSYYCMVLLVFAKRKVESDGVVKVNNYGDLGFHLYGKPGRAIVDFLVFLAQGSFCIGYLVFIGNTLASMVFDGNIYPLSPKYGLAVSGKSLMIWTIFPLEIGMAAIRSLTGLAPFSIVADAAEVAALGLVMARDGISFARRRPRVRVFAGISAVPYGVGVAVYAFEGIGTVLPLEIAMEEKHKFVGVFGLGYFVITLIYGAFGLLGYLAFGRDTREIITLNLGRSPVAGIVQLALCLGLFFTYPLMLNPVHEIVERRLNGRRSSLILRSVVVLSTTLVAVFVPHFADFLSLAGSSVCCSLGFVFPAILHWRACGRESSWLGAILTFVIVAFGVTFGILGTVNAVQQISSRS